MSSYDLLVLLQVALELVPNFALSMSFRHFKTRMNYIPTSILAYYSGYIMLELECTYNIYYV